MPKLCTGDGARGGVSIEPLENVILGQLYSIVRDMSVAIGKPFALYIVARKGVFGQTRRLIINH